jgi:hypothetical protein
MLESDISEDKAGALVSDSDRVIKIPGAKNSCQVGSSNHYNSMGATGAVRMFFDVRYSNDNSAPQSELYPSVVVEEC